MHDISLWLDKLKTLDYYRKYVDEAIANSELIEAVLKPFMNLPIGFEDTETILLNRKLYNLLESDILGENACMIVQTECDLSCSNCIDPMKGTTEEKELCSVSPLYMVLNSHREKLKEFDTGVMEAHSCVYTRRLPLFIEGSEQSSIDVMSLTDIHLDFEDVSKLRDDLELFFLYPLEKGVDTLAIGLYGMRSYSSAEKLINIWKELLVRYDGVYKTVFFAVDNDDIFSIYEKTLQ